MSTFGPGGPTAYPDSWRPQGAPPPDEPVNFEALALAIDAYVATLSDEEFAALVQRTRNGGRPVPNQQPNQQQQPMTYGQ